MLVLAKAKKLNRLLCNLNSCAAVVGNRREILYATLAFCCDLIAAYTHLDELVGNGLGTTLRELLVEGGRTSGAVGITSNNEVGVVLLSIVGERLYVHEILLGSNRSLADVEEYGQRSVAVALNNGSRLVRRAFSALASLSCALRASI